MKAIKNEIIEKAKRILDNPDIKLADIKQIQTLIECYIKIANSEINKDRQS